MNRELSRDELAYHEKVVAQVNAAQAAWQSWSTHIAAKYELSGGDMVDDKGQVTRAEQVLDAMGTDLTD
jgi:hypothetical protein